MQNKYGSLEKELDQLKVEIEDIRGLNDQFIKLFNPAIFEIDLTKPKIICANDMAIRMLGFSLEELMSLNPYDILLDPNIDTIIERGQRVMAGESVPAKMEYKIRTKSGKVKWVTSNERMVKNDGSKYPDRAIIVAVDITESKLIANALKLSEEKYNTLFESSTDAIFIMEADRFVYCNERALEMFNCQMTDIINKTPDQLSPEKQPDGRYSRDRVKELIRAVLDGKPQVFEWVHKEKDGDEFYTQVTLNRFESRSHISNQSILAIVREITEQKFYENAYKETEEKYRTLIDSLIEWVWEIDVNARFIFSSPRVKRILGIKPEKLIGRSLFEFMDEMEIKRVKTKIYDIFSRERAFDSLELVLLNKYGAQVVLDCTGVPIFNENGDLLGYRGTSRDITARRRSENQYQSIWDSTPFGLLSFHLLNDSLILTGTNHACDLILGVKGERLIGQTIENAFPELVQTGIPEAFKRVAKEGIRWMDNHFALSHDYDPNQVAFSGVFEFYAFQTQPDQMVAAILDITERSISEMKLQESEQRFRQLITNMTEGIWVTDKDNNTVFINPALSRILGYPIEEILQKNVTNFLAEESISDFIKHSFETSKHNKAYELTFLTKKGDKVICRVSTSQLFDSNNQPTGSFAVISDITSERKSEQARRDLERRRADFISMSSHELRTPLSIIMGYFEVLQKRIHKMSKEELDRSFTIIEKNIKRLLRLIAGVSDITKIERGIFNLDLELVNVTKYLEDHLSTYRDMLGSQFELKNRLGNVFANLDIDRFSQVLDNIVQNAINNTQDEKRLIKVTCTQDNDNSSFIKVSIKDNGAGILAEDLDGIFEPFVTKPTKYSKKVSGTGIGLYLARAIIERHGGTIHAYSEGLDKGACFIIRIPVFEP